MTTEQRRETLRNDLARAQRITRQAWDNYRDAVRAANAYPSIERMERVAEWAKRWCSNETASQVVRVRLLNVELKLSREVTA